LAAVAIHWDNGEHAFAASLLESLLCKVGNDILSCKLAQEAYILCGQSENALGCLIRHPAAFNAAPPFDSTIIGLTAMGYLENGKLAEAEESSRRAVEMSGGADLISLLALLDCSYLSGKSSDMLEILDNYESLHASNIGRYSLLCRKAAAKVMRGNCNGGFKALVEIFNPKKGEFAKSEIPLSILVDSSLLLWQIIMNLDFRHVIALDEVIIGMTAALDTLDDDEPMKELIRAITLSATLHALESKNLSEYLQTRVLDIHTSMANEKKAKKSTQWNPLSFLSGSTSESKVEDSAVLSVVTENTFSVEVHQDNHLRIEAVKLSLQQLLSKLNDTNIPFESVLNESAPPTWMSLALNKHPFLTNVSANSSTRFKALTSVARSIIHFALSDYAASVSAISPLHFQSYRSTGMSSLQRDILWQMLIEG
jgi:hypothetical protein